MQQKPVTGSWTSVVSLVNSVALAGFARVEERVENGQRAALYIVLGDDAAVRALYASAEAERCRARELGGGRAADEVLCRTQLRSHAMGERSLSLGTNVYGWAIHDIMGSNIAGGRASQTVRGATLEGCIRYAVEATARAGTTLRLDPAMLAAYDAAGWDEIVALAALCGATDEQQAWLAATPERAAEARRVAAERYARQQARQGFAKRAEALFAGCRGIRKTSSWAGADEATVVVSLRNGLTVIAVAREDGAAARLVRGADAARGLHVNLAVERREGHPTLRGVQALLLGMVRQGLSQEVAS